MKLFIIAKPSAKENRVVRVDDQHFQIWIKEPPQENRANKAVIAILSEYLGKPKSSFKYISGLKSKNKTLIIG